MMIKKTILIIFLFSNLFAQGSITRFSNISIKDGLSHSNVYSIIQDQLGFLWFGTTDGLNRFNGINFKVYNYQRSDSTSILQNHILCMVEDDEGDIWVGTKMGLTLYNRAGDNFITFSDPKLNTSIYDIAIFQDSLIVMGTDSLLIYVNKKLKTKSHKESFLNFINIDYTPVQKVYIDRKNNIWTGTQRGFYLLENGLPNLLSMKIDNKIINEFYVKAIAEDRLGNIWIGTNTMGIGKLDLNISKSILINYSNDPFNDFSLSNNTAVTILGAKNGGIWIGTEGGGLNYLAENSGRFVHYMPDPSKTNWLKSASIYSLLEDNVGDIWIGTYDSGINHINLTNQEFKVYRNVPGISKSLGSNNVRQFAEDSKGNIWIACEGSGFNKFDPKTEIFTTYNKLNSSNKYKIFLDIYVDNKDVVWAGTWGNGIIKFNPSNDSLEEFNSENSGLESNNVWSIVDDKNGTIWMGTSFGLSKLNLKTNEIVNYSQKNVKGLTNNWIEVISLDIDGNILLGSAFGLFIFNPSTEEIRSFHNDRRNKNSLSDNLIKSIYIENSNIIWIGTANGLNRINKKTNKITSYFEEDGLPNNSILGIQPDDNGNLWISTNKGISKFNLINQTFNNFSEKNGLQGDAYISNSSYKTRNGNLLFGGLSGFDFFNPSELQENKFVPPVIITQFSLYGKPVKPGNQGSPIETDISLTKKIILSHNQSPFSFEFSALNFRVPIKNKYAFMLEGFDKEWNHSGSDNSATYMNIEPGNYIFRVKGSNNDNLWNEDGTSIVIEIVPPFWQTWWFKLLVFLIIVLNIVLAIRFRIRKIKDQNKALDQEVKNRTSELRREIIEHEKTENNLRNSEAQLKELIASKDKFFSIISHDLRSPFSALLGISGLLVSDIEKLTKEEIIDYILTIEKTSKGVYNLLENLLEWSRVHLGMMEFDPKLTRLSEIVNGVINLLDINAVNKKITLISEVDEKLFVYGDTNMIYTIFRNILSNAIKFTNRKGCVSLKAVRNKSQIEIRIKDSGIGMDQEDLKKLFKIDESHTTIGTSGEKGTGLGLLLCKELITKNSGNIKVNSKLGDGTEFTIILPAEPSY